MHLQIKFSQTLIQGFYWKWCSIVIFILYYLVFIDTKIDIRCNSIVNFDVCIY